MRASVFQLLVPENLSDIQGYEIEQGALFTNRDDLARKRVAIIGSSVGTELKTSSKALIGEEIDLGGVNFKIIGVTKPEGSSGWSNPDEQIYIPLLTASDRLFGRDRVDSIRVEVPNTYTPEEAMISIERVLRREHDIGPGEENNFRINDWSQFTDLRETSHRNLFSFINWNCWHKSHGGRNRCNEYYVGICN